ncbi:MAG: hypothetical protein E6Q97_27260 [Desulfurellales bacterium]|nr:MAG: hypothetical protein E6Q97_27260 [Desulfurellales bacterium]
MTTEPGTQPVVLFVNGEPVSTLNPLPATGGGGGGGGGIVDQGVGSGLPTGAWTVRISNGSGFLAPLTDTELRATPVPVSASSLPLPTGAATEATLGSVEAELTTANANLTDIQGVQTDGTQRSRITDGTNNVTLINSTPGGTEHSVPVRQVGAAVLPTGAATETTLSAINTKTPTLGQKAMAGSHPVVLAVDQTEIPVQIKGLLQNDLTSASVSLSSVRGLNVSVVEPLTAFGELLTAHPTPRVQVDAIYGLLETDIDTFVDGVSGSVTASESMFTCQTGVGAGGYGVARSVRIARYRPGQASDARFTAMYTTPVANSLQLAGVFTATDMLAVGYRGTTFGWLRRIPGACSIQRLTVTGGAGGVETLTVTLDNVGFNIVTPGALSTTATAQLIADRVGGYTGWSNSLSPTSNGATVTFLQNTPAATPGVFTLTSTGTATGTFVELEAGAPNDDTTGFVAQTAWNVDRLDGSKGVLNPSGMTLDPTKLNVWKISYPWLGAGSPVLSILTPDQGWTVVHIDTYPNAYTVPSSRNPSFRIGWIAASLGSTTNLTVKGASACVSVAGVLRPFRNPYGISQTFTGVSTTEYAYIIFRNRAEFSGFVNQREIIPDHFGLTVETANRIARARLVLNPTLSSTVDWQYLDVANSSLEYATPTNVTITGGQQVGAVSAVTQEYFTGRELRLAPGDILAVAIRTASSTATVGVTANWQED